ncbi:hypothetical protein Dsin_030667 [Dipteronia sinensis]|uniref:Uncharacterized protein n=1 Tax=Dipteronia sinensis TaxID=43782 RepID=A0AAD9ZJJ3_9ROSI|nr:hypothetical protein Dsin_030667 [Dipteronia sinensis]
MICPIGCIPLITRKQKHSGNCVENANQVISFFNNKLPGMLRNLTSTLEGYNFVLRHANCLGYDAVINPFKYVKVDPGPNSQRRKLVGALFPKPQVYSYLGNSFSADEL